MGTPFENFVNLELPRRPALLTYEITGYQGDPNDVSAPAILQVAPKGTFYLRNTDAALWRKQTAAADSWVDIGGGGATPSDNTFSANCLSGDVIGAFVRISGADVGGYATVTTADITDSAKMPVVGIIISKATSTFCSVQRLGRVNLSAQGITGFVAGSVYFVGNDGKARLGPPTPAFGAYVMVQPVAVATGPSILEININLSMTKIKG